MGSKLDNFGGKTGSFKPGQSGNPGGRPSIAKALAANGVTGEDMRARLFGIAISGLDSKNTAHQEYCHTWLADRLGLSKQNTLHIDGQIIDQTLVAYVQAAGMTPHERRKALAEIEGEDGDFEDVEG